jgi:hypothetical protein
LLQTLARDRYSLHVVPRRGGGHRLAVLNIWFRKASRITRRERRHQSFPTEVWQRVPEFGRLIKQPDETGGCETQCAYIVVTDADALYERAKPAGADILIDIPTEDYGGRGFT